MATILIVDDQEDERRLLRERVEREYPGVTIDEAANGVEALWYIRRKYNEGDVPDVVVMDITMPRVEGTQAAQRMRARGYDLPIYLRTALPYNISASKFGVNGVIDKATSLEKVCRDHLDQYLNS